MATTVTITSVNGSAPAASIDQTSALAVAKSAAQAVDRNIGAVFGASTATVTVS
jgi:hypothetical protein